MHIHSEVRSYTLTLLVSQWGDGFQEDSGGHFRSGLEITGFLEGGSFDSKTIPTGKLAYTYWKAGGDTDENGREWIELVVEHSYGTLWISGRTARFVSPGLIDG